MKSPIEGEDEIKEVAPPTYGAKEAVVESSDNAAKMQNVGQGRCTLEMLSATLTIDG